jgi:hypothetical protein
VFPHITLWKKEKNKNPLSKFIAFIHHMCQAHAHTDHRPACVGIAAGAWKPSTYPAGHSMTLRCGSQFAGWVHMYQCEISFTKDGNERMKFLKLDHVTM